MEKLYAVSFHRPFAYSTFYILYAETPKHAKQKVMNKENLSVKEEKNTLFKITELSGLNFDENGFLKY